MMDKASRRVSGRERGHKLALLIGYAALTIAILAAYSKPASGYEVSIYGATPILYWIGFSIAVLVAIGISVVAYDTRQGSLALLLAALGVLTVFALPIIRGYFFYGHGDSLVHLGWVKDIADGTLDPQNLIYPGFHLVTVFLAKLGGVEMTQSTLYISFASKLMYVLFVPLALYTLFEDRKAVFVGVFSAFLLLPINHISTHDHFHTFSMTILFSPFIYYLLFAQVTRQYRDASLPSFLSPTSFILPLASIGVVLFHPQAALNVLIIFGTITVVRLAYVRLRPESSVSQMGAIYGQFVIIAVVFALWAGQFDNTYRVLDLIITGVQETIAGNEQAGEVIQDRGESSRQVGTSLFELFVKLFGVSFVYTLLAGGLVLSVLSPRIKARSGDADGVVTYLAYGGLVLVPFIGVHFLGDTDAYLFRQVGFAMVIVNILGAIALYNISNIPARRWLRPAAAVSTVLVLAISLMVVFSSPFIALPNSQVTQTEMEGYDTLFDQQDDELQVMGIRTGGGTFADALQYNTSQWPNDPVLNETVFRNGVDGASYEGSQYLAISEYDRTRDIEVYRGFRYPESGFEYVETAPGANRIQTNGDVNVYYLE